MADPFLGEIRIFANTYAPQGWAFCNGQTLPISQNTALFALLGVTYGGNGTSNFQLPNLQASVPVQAGQGPGLSPYSLGQAGGAPSVTLTSDQLATHSHTPSGSSAGGTQNSPAGGVWSSPSAGRGIVAYDPNAGSGPQMAPNALAAVGDGQPHENRMPFVVLNYCIALQGVFPQRP